MHSIILFKEPPTRLSSVIFATFIVFSIYGIIEYFN